MKRTSRAAMTGLCSLFLLFGCSSSASKSKPPCSSAGAQKCQAIQQVCSLENGQELCGPCPEGQYTATGDACTAIPGNLISHDFGLVTLDPGAEITPCQSWTLNNETEIWVNSVEMINGGAYHHSNWLWVPDTLYPGPDGQWDCTTRHAVPTDKGFDEPTAVFYGGGVLFAQSTQASQQVQKFADGAALRLPPHVRIAAGTHLLNVTENPVTTDMKLNIYAMDRADVRVPLAPFAFENHGLTIQPHAVSNFTSSCDFSAANGGTPGDLDIDVYYVMPHYHALGASFSMTRYGGSNDGEVIYSIGQFDSEAHGKAFDPPVSMRGSKGFQFTCGYKNPYSVEVQWGIGDVSKDPTAGEMCVMLGFARSSDSFGSIAMTSTQTSASNGVYDYSASCLVVALPFKQGLSDN